MKTHADTAPASFSRLPHVSFGNVLADAVAAFGAVYLAGTARHAAEMVADIDSKAMLVFVGWCSSTFRIQRQIRGGRPGSGPGPLSRLGGRLLGGCGVLQPPWFRLEFPIAAPLMEVELPIAAPLIEVEFNVAAPLMEVELPIAVPLMDASSP